VEIGELNEWNVASTKGRNCAEGAAKGLCPLTEWYWCRIPLMSSAGSGVIKTVAQDRITPTASPIVNICIIVASLHPVFPLSRVHISGANSKEITRVVAARHLNASGPRFAQAYAPMWAGRSNEDAHGTHCVVCFPQLIPW
jgi:hypothetical protein